MQAMRHPFIRADHAPRLGTVNAVREGNVMRRLKLISRLAGLPMRFIVVALLMGAALTPTGTRAAEVSLVAVATGFDRPLFVTGAGTNNEQRLFVVEQAGIIRVVDVGTGQHSVFLDITGIVNDRANERGLLGLAFHPDYEINDRFFVHYTDDRGDIVIAGYTVSDDPDLADAGSAEVILRIPHRQAENHNGGMLAFGPDDGYLYIAVGDGGAGQSANAQKKTTLLGKILRIDVDRASGDRAYAIPADNPFSGSRKSRSEIWAFGLRNPFRFSFDRQNGNIFIGDVGQDAWEEIDFGRRGKGGLNFGWDIMEGRHCFNPPSGCDKRGLRLPIHEYSHKVGNVVTSGYVYRGDDMPDLVGTYVFTDFGSRDLWGLKRNSQGNWERSVLLRADKQLNIASFGESDAGELFAVDLVSGTLFRIAAA
jgi:glucose/arabinose dehydrogenase